jgi:DNA-binding CsgD family transcriptional regulator
MLTGKSVLIVSPNRLICLGLEAILMEYFSAENVLTTASITGAVLDHEVDYVFLHPETFVLGQERFRGFKGDIVVLADQEAPKEQLLPAALNVTCSESEMIEQLHRIFSLGAMHKTLHKKANLTSREIDVLKLVARGQLNKQIAERLSISMHTVISHRKNITRKLAIKTVSALTMYAVLNGLISSKDIR